MHVLHPGILLVILVAAFVTLGVPGTTKERAAMFQAGLFFAVLAFVMNAIFQWSDPSPLNLILMNGRGGTFEFVLLSIAVACISRALLGLVFQVWRAFRQRE